MQAIAFLLGFVGYLPPGTINLTVVQMSLSQPKLRWQLFILFAAVMEFVYCFVSLMGLELLLKQTQFVNFLSWSSVVIFFLLGLASFKQSTKSETQHGDADLKRGVLVAILNPLQIPFWLIWGVYVMEAGWLKPQLIPILIFSIICSAGTIAVLYMYAVAGKKVIQKLNVNRTLLNRFIGSLLLALAIYQTIKLLTHP